jgi:hypothetical protein
MTTIRALTLPTLKVGEALGGGHVVQAGSPLLGDGGCCCGGGGEGEDWRGISVWAAVYGYCLVYLLIELCVLVSGLNVRLNEFTYCLFENKRGIINN